MSGALGLTKAGQQIDTILTNENPKYSQKLQKFLNKFTMKVKNIRKTLQGNNDENQFLLNMVKQHYYARLATEFKNTISHTLYTNSQSYIHALTRTNFIPNTRTQQSLIRKQLSNTSAVLS
jgi:hypothetical protein